MKYLRIATGRLAMTSIVLVVLFMFLAAVAYLKGRRVERDSVAIRNDAVPGTIHAHALRAAISRSVGYAMLAHLTDDDVMREKALDISGRADHDFQKAATDYQATIRLNPQKDRLLLANLQAKWTDFQRHRSAYVAMLESSDRSTRNAFFVQSVLPAYEDTAAAAEELLTYNHANTTANAKSIGNDIRILRWTVLIVLVLASFCVAILLTTMWARRRQQRATAESERRLRLVLDNLFTYVAVLQLDGTVIEVNQAALDAATLQRSDVVGTRLDQAYWWAHSPEAQARVRRALQTAAAGQAVRYDMEARAADGRKHAMDFSCGPLRDAAGRVILLVATAIDITARKQLEQQVLRAQRMDAIGMLAGGLAHDMNNILAPMVMAAGVLRLRVMEASEQKMVALIETGAMRGANIIRQLLTFSRGEEGAKGPVQLRHLIKDMAHIIDETFPRNIELRQNGSSELWAVIANATQLHQVLLNLCVNARDAMPQGGKLSLIADNTQLDEDTATVHPQAKPGPYVLLTVSDTGEGIPHGNLDRIFEPFFTTKPVGKGTGLGLSTVFGIVKNHGGFLTVDSELGEGATFKIYLPADEHEAVAAPIAASDAFARGQGELILLVDDEEPMLKATRELLEQHNYKVIAAGNGEDALRLFVEHRGAIKVVLTDMDMPRMGGPELIRAMKVIEPDLRFMVMSGTEHTGTDSDLASLKDGQVIKKPCDPAHCLETLHGMLHPAPGP